jgi:hypothetical protein
MMQESSNADLGLDHELVITEHILRFGPGFMSLNQRTTLWYCNVDMYYSKMNFKSA